MPVPGRPTCSPGCLDRAQRAVARALWHYTVAPVARPYRVRGCVPDPDRAAVTVALWTGPGAREKWNLFLYVPLVSGGLPVPATQIVTGLMRLARGTHLFGFTGRRIDGKPVLNGSELVEGRPAPCLCAGTIEQQEPRGFYFERPGELTRYD
ncbi:hypothetical protein P8605_16350 [Streptomyces sp. T-3]|nr:hypothetical protein [Streptomyces sp. T-3]